MSLQQWDNAVSIVSNVIVIGGVFFGGSKLSEFFKEKKQTQAFDAAITLKKEIDSVRSDYNNMRFNINIIITSLTDFYNKKVHIDAKNYYKIQYDMKEMTENTSRVLRAFIKVNHYNVIIKDQSSEDFYNLLQAIGDTQSAISEIMSSIIKAMSKPLIEEDDLIEIKKANTFHSKKMEEVNTAVAKIDVIKFNDLFDFSKVNKKVSK